MIGVGDTVVCVDAGPCPCCGNHPPLVEGAVYRIQRVAPLNNRLLGTILGVDVGVDLRSSAHPRATLIGAHRFRKVQPKSASKHIDRMKRIPSRQREDA